MNDIVEKINKAYHYRLKYIISVCIAIACIVFLGMVAIAVCFTDAASDIKKDGVTILVLVLIPLFYLRWTWINWRTPNKGVCQYHDIDQRQLKQMIECEIFHDYNLEKIPSNIYQESQNYYMVCGRFIAKKSVLSIEFGSVGSYGGKGASSNTYSFILCNGEKVSVSTPFRIELMGKLSPDLKEDTKKRNYWYTFKRVRKSWIKTFYKQWVSDGNQPISLLINEEVVTNYKNQLMKYIIKKESR